MNPNPSSQQSLQLGEFAFEPATRTLRNAAGEVVPLAQKPFLVLLHLVQNRQRLVTRSELLERFWAGREVYDEALTRCMSSIRKALDDQGDPARFIETRRADGYRYIGPCTEIEAASEPALAPVQPPSADAPTRRTRTPWLLVAAAVGVLWAGVMLVRGFDAHRPADLKSMRSVTVQTMISTSDTADDWLARELALRAIGALSRINGLEVAVRGPEPDEARILLKLTLEPSQLRFEAGLQRAGQDRPEWSYSQVYPRREIMKAEREWVRHLSRDGDLPMREIPPRVRSEGGYVSFLRGHHLRARGDAAALSDALVAFRATLDEDPGFADAHAGIAEVELLRGDLAAARTAAETALHLDADQARAHLVLGELAQLDWDWVAADAHFDRALTIDINDAEARRVRALSLCYRRRLSECLDGLRRAAALDPASPAVSLALGDALRWSGEHAAAVVGLQAAVQRWPGDWRLELALADAELAAGDGDAAIIRYSALLKAQGLARVGGPLAYALARAGRKLDATALRDSLRSAPGASSRVMLALASVGLDDHAAAIAALEAAADAGDRLALTLAVDERFAALRGLPRYEALLARTGLAGPVR